MTAGHAGHAALVPLCLASTVLHRCISKLYTKMDVPNRHMASRGEVRLSHGLTVCLTPGRIRALNLGKECRRQARDRESPCFALWREYRARLEDYSLRGYSGRADKVLSLSSRWREVRISRVRTPHQGWFASSIARRDQPRGSTSCPPLPRSTLPSVLLCNPILGRGISTSESDHGAADGGRDIKCL